MLKLLATGRAQGKTRRLVDWVKQGKEIDTYPGFSRIIVTVDERRAQQIRKDHELSAQQVFSFRDYRSMHGAYHGLEVGIDDIEMLIANLFSHAGSGRVVCATMTAELRTKFT